MIRTGLMALVCDSCGLSPDNPLGGFNQLDIVSSRHQTHYSKPVCPML
jgi:hypothetical protein